MAKKEKITKEQLDLLRGQGNWDINDIPPDKWSELPPGITMDCVAIMASGTMDASRVMHGLNAIAGFDKLRIEHNPKGKEPEGNAYHYIVTVSGGCYYLHGPYRRETRTGHWFEVDDLDKYGDG